MKNSPPGMSPSYELYRNLETYPVGCFIIRLIHLNVYQAKWLPITLRNKH